MITDGDRRRAKLPDCLESPLASITVCQDLEKLMEVSQQWSWYTGCQHLCSPRACLLYLEGGDVMVAAETGSGKTGAFALPVLQLVHETLTERLSKGRASAPDTG